MLRFPRQYPKKLCQLAVWSRGMLLASGARGPWPVHFCRMRARTLLPDARLWQGCRMNDPCTAAGRGDRGAAPRHRAKHAVSYKSGCFSSPAKRRPRRRQFQQKFAASTTIETKCCSCSRLRRLRVLLVDRLCAGLRNARCRGSGADSPWSRRGVGGIVVNRRGLAVESLRGRRGVAVVSPDIHLCRSCNRHAQLLP